MNAVEEDVKKLVTKELNYDNEHYPMFHSRHEGFAVLKEEIEELRDAYNFINNSSNWVWEEIKADNEFACNARLDLIESHAINAAVEAIQVAAMIQKMRMSELKEGNKDE